MRDHDAPAFIPVEELAKLSGYQKASIYDQHYKRRGALAPILTKFGGRLGAWRPDWERYVASQRRLPDAA